MYVKNTYYMELLVQILLTNVARKQLNQCPEYIARKFDYWLNLIRTIGLYEARKYKGFHDELLHGDRHGQRSVRLSKGYRVIYQEIGKLNFKIIKVLSVNKHDY